MSEQALVVNGQQVTMKTYDGALNDKGNLSGVRRFVAFKYGYTEKDIEKKTKKVVFDELVAQKLATREELKALSKEYAEHKREFHKDSSIVNGMFAADPSYRKSTKVWKNKRGETCAATQYRKERSLNQSALVRLQEAEAKNKKFEAIFEQLGLGDKLKALTA
jgi:hypothetical protein